LRSILPNDVSANVGATNVTSSIEAVFKYIESGEWLHFDPEKWTTDLVGNPYAGVLGSVEGNENTTPYGYYTDGFSGGIYTSVRDLASYTENNFSQLNSLTRSPERLPEHFVNMQDIGLSVFPDGSTGSMLAGLITRLPDGEFAYPYLVDNVHVYSIDEEGNRIDLVEGQDFILRSNPIGFTIIQFIQHDWRLKYFANYISYEPPENNHHLVAFTGYVLNYDYTQQDGGIREQLLTVLQDAYPDGVIDITDADAIASEVDLSNADLATVVREILDEARYDIDSSPELPMELPEFIRMLNSDELLELYCMKTAQAVQILNMIIDSEFELRINGAR
jgi:hypothetical protein